MKVGGKQLARMLPEKPGMEQEKQNKEVERRNLGVISDAIP